MPAGLGEVLELPKEEAILVDRLLAELARHRVLHELLTGFLNGDRLHLWFLGGLALGFPFTHQGLCLRPVPKASGFADFVVAEKAVNPDRAMTTAILPTF